MAVQPVEGGSAGPTWDRLEDQLGWYDRKSIDAQRAYKRVKLSRLIVGARGKGTSHTSSTEPKRS